MNSDVCIMRARGIFDKGISQLSYELSERQAGEQGHRVNGFSVVGAHQMDGLGVALAAIERAIDSVFL